MWKPPPELGLTYVLGVSSPPDRLQALRTYATTGEAGALGSELLVFDHKALHPSFNDAARLMQHADRKSGPGWELLQGLRAWRAGNFKDAYAYIARAARKEPFPKAILGFLTERGIGVPASQERAKKFYIAAEDCALALVLLAEMFCRKRRVRSARHMVTGRLHDGLNCWLGDSLKHDDPVQAKQLFQAAHHDYGQVKMAEMHDTGCGGIADVNKAKRLYEAATSSGNSKAMCMQGIAWRKGTFGRVDLERARLLFEMAAEWQDTTGMVLLGSMYESGGGAPRNANKASELYRKASDMGDSFGYLSLAKTLISVNETEARELLEKAQTFGNDVVQCEALYELGKLYEHGRGVDRDFVQAFDMYKRCHFFGISSTTIKAITRIGHLLERGHGIAKNENSARACYEYAAGLEDGEAAHRLGLIAERRDDTEDAAQWYLTGSSFGWVDSAYRLGKILEARDASEAVECYSTAAELGCIDAQVRLGRMLVLGRGVDRDLDKGILLLSKASENGSTRAKRTLWKLDEGSKLSKRA